MKILIVDDHPMIAEYLRGAAAKAFAGAEVRTADEEPATVSALR